MSTFKNEFSWSISRDRVFQTCPRQYYFNYYGYWDGWETGAPAKTRQIYILKQCLRLKKSTFCFFHATCGLTRGILMHLNSILRQITHPVE